ncbi:hypothetical protein TRFO_42169 [Tritrichomonas foetus]|uniref:DDE-1 domain-containing protein n=1 Tax=Tritrichomonas foetus TaxID=1144522 RepID=A0A1J4KXL2_9EUKA|nr:hypothetical protein TRFO_42169 [Tritrichomonas foetus]|eukprot:OHT15975.1 hypothetical protein TRFO_42169 [Tritrichomonas foetus]
MDKSRLFCSEEEIDNYFAKIYNIIETIPAAFIFKCDESGFSPYQDSKSVHVIVPTAHTESSIPIGKDSAKKRSTVIFCIAGNGTYLKPTVVLPQKTINKEVLLYGLNTDFANLQYNASGFIDTRIFNIWAEEVSFPEVQREKYEYYNEV